MMFAMVALCAVLLSCQQRDAVAPTLAIVMRVQPNPPHVGNCTIEIDLHDTASAPVQGATVRLEGDMAHPGMAPSFAETREIEPGRYRGNLELTMAGDWTVLVEARLASGTTVHRALPLPRVLNR